MKSARYIGSHNIDEILRAEKEKRKRARLLQVRHQSQEIATEIRNAVSAEKQYHLRATKDKIQDKLIRKKDKQLADQQQQYGSSLSSIGESHKRATFVERTKLRKVVLEEAATKVAENRGSNALKTQKSKQKETLESKTTIIRKKKDVRTKENERAAVIASLPPPPPDSLSEALEKKEIPIVFRNRWISSESSKLKSHARMMTGSMENLASPKSPMLNRKECLNKRGVPAAVRDIVKTDGGTPSKARTCLLTGSAENLSTLPKSPSVILNNFEHRQAKALVSVFKASANKENAFHSDLKQLGSNFGSTGDADHEEKIDVSFATRRQGRKVKVIVSKKIKRKSVNKRRSIVKHKSSEKELNEIFNKELPSTPEVLRTPTAPMKTVPGKPLTPFTLWRPVANNMKEQDEVLEKYKLPEHTEMKQDSCEASPAQSLETNTTSVPMDYFKVAQEDLHLLKECEELMKELEAMEHQEKKVESKSCIHDHSVLKSSENQQPLIKAIEDGINEAEGIPEFCPNQPSYQKTLPFDYSAPAISPHDVEAASILNIGRIEDDEESVNSSPDLALRRNCILHPQRHFFPSVFLDDSVSRKALDNETTSRRKCVDNKKCTESTANEPQITIATVTKKDVFEDNQETGLIIKTTVRQSNCLIPNAKSSEELNPSSTVLPSHIVPSSTVLVPPFFTRSPQVQISSSVSAYQQYIMSQSEQISSDSPSIPVERIGVYKDIRSTEAPIFKTRLAHSSEDAKSSNVNHPAIFKSKSVNCVVDVNRTGISENRVHDAVQQPIEQNVRVVNEPTCSSQAEQVCLNSRHVPLSPEFTQVTPADVRLALVRVLASRRKTPSEESKIIAIASSSSVDGTNFHNRTESVKNVQSASSSNLNRKPTWDQVLRASENSFADPLNILEKKVALVVSDAKVEQCQNELQRIEKEQQELLNQLNELRQTQSINSEGAISLASPIINNSNANCQLFSEEHTSGSSSPDNWYLLDTSIASSASPEFYLRPKPPATIPRGMDQTPHELSTIWEADTPLSIHTSSVCEALREKQPAPPLYFYKTKLSDHTEASQTQAIPGANFSGTAVAPTSGIKVGPDPTQLASTPKKAAQFRLSLLGDGPGIMEQSEITLVDAETTCTTGVFTPPDYLPPKLRHTGISGRPSPIRQVKQFVTNLQGSETDLSSTNGGGRPLTYHKWHVGRDEKSSPATSNISENSISDSLLSFEQHELSTTSPESFSPNFHT